MKLTRKLIAAMLCMCMAMSLTGTALAAELSATYDKASYYDIAVTAYSRMLTFQNGGVVAAADQSKKYGLIDPTGKVVVPFQYTSIETLAGGLFSVAQKADESGRPSCFGVINAKGETVLAPSDECRSVTYRNGVIRVAINYDDQYYYPDWTAATVEDYWGWSDYQWEEPETPPELEDYYYTKVGDYYRVSKYENGSSLRGILDSNYKVVVAPGEYRYVGTPNADGYVSITKTDGSTDIQKDGKVVKTFTDKQVTTEVYFRHLVFSTTNGSKYGMMDVNGNVLLEEKFSAIMADDNNYIRTAVTEENSWEYIYGLYTQDCKQVFANEYSELSYMTDGKYRLHKGEYFGVSQVSGATATAVIPLKYLNMTVHTYQFIELYDGSKYSVVDLNNKVIVPESSEKINAFKGNPAGLWKTLSNAMFFSESYDGYTESVLPFLSQTNNGWVTVYADYKTGKVTGQLNTRASNINEDGRFVYQDKNGLYGFAWLEGSGAPSGGEQTPSGGAPATKPVVILTNQNLTVNGEAKNTEIYNIDGSNYFKLRDMAALLTGTGSQFSVEFDAERSTIVVKTGEAYTAVGGELETGTDKSASAVASAQSVEIDGETVDLTAYNIGGNNFFKLRDLGTALDFGVDYDGATATMVVTSK